MGNTLSQYAVIALAVGGGLLFTKREWCNEQFNKLFPPTQTAIQNERPEKKVGKKNKPRQTGTPVLDSGDENRIDRKRKIVSNPVGDNQIGDKISPAEGDRQVSSPEQKSDQGMSDELFAQQFQNARSGTKLGSSAKPAQRVKRTKLSKQEDLSQTSGTKRREDNSPSISTSASSATDGDEVGSPTSEPASTAATSGPEDTSINDMLEPETPKPKILNITSVSNNKSQKVQPAKKPAEEALTKKQRAAKRKAAESRKLVRESLEAHDAKRQVQQRTARLADGTSKQTQTNNFLSKQNAWQAGPGKSGENALKASTSSSTDLLDTRDKGEPITVALGDSSILASNGKGDSGSGPTQNGKDGLTPSVRALFEQGRKSQKNDWADEMNGETDKGMDEVEIAQHLRQFKRQEQEESWQPVASRKSKKLGAKKDGEASSYASSGSQPDNNTVTDELRRSPKTIRIGSKARGR